jgi:hypothetical protein
LSLPTATLIGFSLVAVAVYLGLRGRAHYSVQTAVPAGGSSAEIMPSARAAEVPSADGSNPLPVGPSAPSPSAPRELLLDRAAAEVGKALEAQRGRLHELCKPGSAVTYQLNYSFSPEGRQLARGISVPRTARDGVADCMQLKLPEIAIEAPGTPLSLVVPFTL